MELAETRLKECRLEELKKDKSKEVLHQIKII